MHDPRESAPGRSAGPPAGPGPDGGAVSDAPFETSLGRLEEIVDRLEHGDLELGAALAAFEEGVALTRRCGGQLEDARRRIDALVREGERWTTRALDEEASDPSEDGGGDGEPRT